MVVFSFSYSGNGPFEVSARGIYTKEDVIKGSTPTVAFEIAEVTITNKKDDADVYFEIADIDTANENAVKGTGLKIVNVINGTRRGNRVYFENKDGSVCNPIKFSLNGSLAFVNWNKKWELAIGYRGKDNKKDEGTKNYITINLEDIEPIESLKVIVKKDMDLGKGIAGYPLDTSSSKSNGHPAVIKVVGPHNSDVKIFIPKTTSITNNSGGSLPVTLSFKKNGTLSGNEIFISEKLIEKVSGNNNGSLGKIDNIEINGRCESNKNSRGKYTGSFTVRVEYDD